MKICIIELTIIAKKISIIPRAKASSRLPFDVSKAIVELMDSKISSERFILVGKNISYKEIFQKIATALNKPAPNKVAKKWMMQLAWRYESIRAAIRRKSPAITKETAMTACEKYFYDSSKIEKAINFEFNSIDDAIKNTARFL